MIRLVKNVVFTVNQTGKVCEEIKLESFVTNLPYFIDHKVTTNTIFF